MLPFAGIVTHEKYNTLQHRSIGHYTHEKNALCAAAGVKLPVDYQGDGENLLEAFHVPEHFLRLGTQAEHLVSPGREAALSHRLHLTARRAPEQHSTPKRAFASARCELR